MKPQDQAQEMMKFAHLLDEAAEEIDTALAEGADVPDEVLDKIRIFATREKESVDRVAEWLHDKRMAVASIKRRIRLAQSEVASREAVLERIKENLCDFLLSKGGLKLQGAAHRIWAHKNPKPSLTIAGVKEIGNEFFDVSIAVNGVSHANATEIHDALNDFVALWEGVSVKVGDPVLNSNRFRKQVESSGGEYAGATLTVKHHLRTSITAPKVADVEAASHQPVIAEEAA